MLLVRRVDGSDIPTIMRQFTSLPLHPLVGIYIPPIILSDFFPHPLVIPGLLDIGVVIVYSPRATAGRSQGLSVEQVVVGRGRQGAAISQLCRVRDGPEQTQTCARQAGAPEQHVSWRVSLLPAHLTQCRRTLQVATLLAVPSGVTADPV